MIDLYTRPGRRSRPQTRAAVRPQKARGEGRQRWNREKGAVVGVTAVGWVSISGSNPGLFRFWSVFTLFFLKNKSNLTKQLLKKLKDILN